MRRITIFLLPALAASLTLAACGGSTYSAGSSSKSNAAATATTQPHAASSSSASTGGVVKTASNSTLGATVLTNSAGLTLYALSGERAGRFICTSSSCVGVWHPLAAAATAAPSGSVGSLGTVKRPDGSEQVTYKGMPLYTFAEDQSPGQAKGQGIKDVGTWSAVRTGAGATRAAGTPPASEAGGAPKPEAPPAESGGGYHY